MEGYYIHPLPVCHALFPDFDPLMNRFCIVILHKYLRFSHCSVRVYPICTLCITRYRIRFITITTYSIFTVIAPAFPSLEAVKRLCVSLRSAARSAVAVRTVALLVLVPFLPCRMRLLQQILDSHLFRSGYAVY